MDKSLLFLAAICGLGATAIAVATQHTPAKPHTAPTPASPQIAPADKAQLCGLMWQIVKADAMTNANVAKVQPLLRQPNPEVAAANADATAANADERAMLADFCGAEPA